MSLSKISYHRYKLFSKPPCRITTWSTTWPKEYTLLVSGDATKIPRGLVDAGITLGSTLERVPLHLIFVDNRLYAVRPSGKFGTLKFGWTHEGGWLSILASTFVRKIDIVGRGYSGYNTRLCKPLLPILYPNKDSLKDCKFFTIFLGANDACATPQQHVPVEEYKSNLSWMIEYIHKLDVPTDHISLISLPPIDENKWGAIEIAKGRAITRRLDACATYAVACQEVANVNEVSFVNLYEAMLMQKNWESFLSDGLHFSRKGSEFLARILENLLTDKLGDLKWWFPDWKVINPNDPAEFISHYLQSQM